MTITRVDLDTFAVVTDTVLADGTLVIDTNMALVGDTLRSREQKGYLRTGGLLRLKLGAVTFDAVQRLRVGDTCQVIGLTKPTQKRS